MTPTGLPELPGLLIGRPCCVDLADSGILEDAKEDRRGDGRWIRFDKVCPFLEGHQAGAKLRVGRGNAVAHQHRVEAVTRRCVQLLVVHIDLADVRQQGEFVEAGKDGLEQTHFDFDGVALNAVGNFKARISVGGDYVLRATFWWSVYSPSWKTSRASQGAGPYSWGWFWTGGKGLG